MKHLFNAGGMRAMGLSWVLLALAIAAGAGIVAGSHWYAQK